MPKDDSRGATRLPFPVPRSVPILRGALPAGAVSLDVAMGSHDSSFLTVVVVMAGVTGLVVGSFLNVVVYRVPLGLSVSKPRSFCPDCRRQLAWWENVPLLSWIVLRGRCRVCGLSISLRYPAVELATGLVFALVAWAWRGTLPAAGYCCLAASMIAILLVECSGHRAPLAVAGIGTGLGLPFFAATAFWKADWRVFVGPLVGVIIGLGVVTILRQLDPKARDPRTFGRSAVVIAGCWLGGMDADPVVAALVVGAGTYMLCALAAWVSGRQRVRVAPGGTSASVTGPAAAAPLAVTVSAALLAALVVQGWR
jgi:leader peptidase (prepilin peptidase) / N-methyltransferase